MNYIYGYENTITNKWYVGQTTNSIEERNKQHLYSATHERDKDYNTLFHKKIREYGIENFNLYKLEAVENKEDLDERERFWIAEKHSFVKDNGYNLTIGGQKRKDSENYQDVRRSFSTQEEINNVIEEIKGTKKLTDIAKSYNVSLSLICMINSGKKYKIDSETYPLRAKIHPSISEEEVELIISMLQDNKSNAEIAQALCLDADVVYRINTGKAHKRSDLSYPLRKTENDPKVIRANKIKALLQENRLNNKQIAQLVGCDPSVVSNINYGKNYKDPTLTYPLRPKKS